MTTRQTLHEMSAAQHTEFHYGAGFTAGGQGIIAWNGFNNGYPALTVGKCRAMNATNIPNLPRDVKYHVLTGDMDLNGSGSIEYGVSLFGTFSRDYGEFEALRYEVSSLNNAFEIQDAYPSTHAGDASALVPDYIYKLLGNSRGVRVTVRTVHNNVDGVVWDVASYTLATVPSPSFVRNDTLVPWHSGLGLGGLAPLVSKSKYYNPAGTVWVPDVPNGRNHGNIGDNRTCVDVIPWLIQAEHPNGL